MPLLRLAIAATMIVAVWGAAGLADEPPRDEPSLRDGMSRLDALLQRVEALERRLQQVEQRLTAAAVPETPANDGKRTRTLAQPGFSRPLWIGDIHEGPWVEKILKQRLQPSLDYHAPARER